MSYFNEQMLSQTFHDAMNEKKQAQDEPVFVSMK